MVFNLVRFVPLNQFGEIFIFVTNSRRKAWNFREPEVFRWTTAEWKVLDLARNQRKGIDNAVEILQSYTKFSIYFKLLLWSEGVLDVVYAT